MRLAEMTYWQAEAYFQEHDTVLLTIGCLESHGSHNVLGVDTMIPEKLLTMIEARTEVVAAPGIPYGVCEDMTSFSGTVSLGEDCMYHLLTRITDGLLAHGAKKILFLNGHGGNIPTLNRVCIELSRKGALGVQLNWWIMAGQLNPAWAGGHGGGEETAGMLAVNPDLVHFDRLREQELINDLGADFPTDGFDRVTFGGIGIPVPRDVTRYTTNGWIGPDHPKDATVEWGEEMLTAVADYIAAFIEAFEKVEVK
ncbi:creatininase family protein [Ihubacter sp. mB4P-1]|uniref:creatininase family protein n=1 Tax=Ihubacter sp. mB4P-1 TaxID=3242370 RepID=UPI00137B4793